MSEDMYAVWLRGSRGPELQVWSATAVRGLSSSQGGKIDAQFKLLAVPIKLQLGDEALSISVLSRLYSMDR